MDMRKTDGRKADSLFRALPVGGGILIDRVFVEVNDAFCDMLGHTRDELIGRSSRMVYPTDEDFEYVGREKYRQIAETGSGQLEARFLRKDGEILDVLLSSTYLDLSDPSKGVTFTAMDITRSKKEREELKRSDSLLKAINRGINDIVWMMDMDMRFTYVSPSIEKVLEYRPEEVLGTSVLSYFPEEDLVEVRANIKQRLRSPDAEGKNVVFEYRMVSRSGKLVPVEVSSSVKRDEDGNVLEFYGVTRDISERMKRDMERGNLHRIMASLPSGVMVIDDSEKVVHLNDAARRFFGSSGSDEGPKACGDVLGCRNRNITPEGCGRSENCASCRILKYIRDVLAGGEGVEGEDLDISVEDRSEPRSLIFSVVPMVERGERMALVSFNDITPRRAAERDLAISEAKLSRAEQVAGIGYWEFDMGKGTVRASEGAKRLYGIVGDDLRITEVQQIPLPEYRGMLDSALKDLIDKGLSYDVEFKIERPSDSEVIDIHSIAEYDADRNVVFGIIRDETDRKAMEEALRKSESLLNNTQRIARIGGWEYDVEKKAMFWTKELYHLHGIEDAEIEPGSTHHIDRSITCYDPEYRPLIRSAFERCVSEGEPYDLEFPFTSYMGEKMWIRTSGIPFMKRGKVEKVMGTLMDITSLKRAREDLIEQRDIASFHLDLLNHDIGNLHQGLYSSMQLLEMTDDPDKRRSIIRLSLGILTRSMKLTEDVKLLSHMRDSKIAFEPVDIVSMIKRVSSMVMDMFTERDVRIDMDAPTEKFTVTAEPFLEQLVLNLLHNAVKCQREKPRVEVKVRRQEGKLIVDFDDHGPGFPASSIEELIKKTRMGVGTRRGLGLVLSAEIAKRHDATLEVMPTVKGDPSKGTRFRLSLMNGDSSS
ncbi:MAG: PAS domain-containing sensor histidine kinase [Candidatus Thermoplasmatota archaeon]|nr:PAS domain-containing sensor histidine kinase [Candidatus Thermoplasmatota archaeon]